MLFAYLLDVVEEVELLRDAERLEELVSEWAGGENVQVAILDGGKQQ